MQAGFGLGRLHHLFDRQKREQVVRSALDAGFRYFDLAPAYGDGLNEKSLGQVLGSARDSVMITTKFGIPFRPIGELPGPIYFALRVAAKGLRTSFGAQYDRRDFSPAPMVASLEASLRRLGTDRVDILLVHEPMHIDQFRTLAETWSEMERQQRLGKLRRFGISSEAAMLLEAESQGLVPDAAIRMVPMCDTICTLPPAWFQKREVCVFNVVKHLSRTLGPGRIETRALIEGFARALPTCRPIFATHNLDQIRKMGEMLASLADATPPHGVSR